MNKLEQLKQYTTVVADSGDFQQIKKYKPVDATTNPSLLLKAALMPEYQTILNRALLVASSKTNDRERQAEYALENLMIAFGCELLKVIPGRVSTEVDASLSFDTEATVEEALRIIERYDEEGVSKDKVLIKIASTWEGIQAARILEKRGIHCNLTLLFSLEQAILCAEAGVTLISPFVGRIYDWFVAHENRDFSGQDDPGVKSVATIYNYYKHYGYDTIVMGASFRNIGQIEALAGCDYLTISPQLMQELQEQQGELERALSPDKVKPTVKLSLDEKNFRFRLNQNAMAHEKLAEGIRLFARDWDKLKALCISKQKGLLQQNST